MCVGLERVRREKVPLSLILFVSSANVEWLAPFENMSSEIPLNRKPQIDEDQHSKSSGGEKQRGHWENPFDFFVSCLGYAVGLGNIWRFPFLCYQHGGGSFLIPYFVLLLVAGLPVFFLEVVLGQYAGVGPVKTFALLTPCLKGLGYGMVSVSALFTFFYIVVVSWSIWYLFASLGTSLDWSTCDQYYNLPTCVPVHGNATTITNATASVEEYWERYVLGFDQVDSWTHFGYPRWQSVGTLFLAWTMVAFSLIKGVKSSGKVIYFTSFFPYAILIILAIRSFTLPGAWMGIKYYLTPTWSHLLGFEIWVDAATQVIFSLGPACGCVITLSSYNHFQRNCQRDVILVALSNSLTSVFSGMVVFAILGFMAHTANKEMGEVVQDGPGLAFIVYPEVVAKMTGSNVFAALFFAMLISLALGSIFGGFETIITGLCDEFPTLRHHKSTLVVIISSVMFSLGLPFTCPGGIHMFNLFNESAPSWNLIIFALSEVVIVAFFYGTDKILDNIEEMGMTLNWFQRAYWTKCWKFATPLVLVVLLLAAWMNFGHIQYMNHFYPMWVQVIGYIITGSTLCWIPIFMVPTLIRSYHTTEFRTLLQPTTSWTGQSYDSCVK
ncbi:sodium- and chloride-dependent glycine transporter 2-like [Tigriopus californicus]|uniref:sodium- and chloride-dependent glycine transporter 2-like n=1 Tax=Tigriopus californicus TaxID=6832 RepID=UPI0027DA2B3C|nr:sodium- and chloride-dependent glycine transporter 2-like [Tigriopus californicus]